jgi:hypothetical protein
VGNERTEKRWQMREKDGTEDDRGDSREQKKDGKQETEER